MGEWFDHEFISAYGLMLEVIIGGGDFDPSTPAPFFPSDGLFEMKEDDDYHNYN